MGKCKNPWKMTITQLKRTVKSTVKTNVRAGFVAVRYAKVLNLRNASPQEVLPNVGHISVMETGGQCTISGSGPIYENFMKTGKIENYSGYGQKPVTFFEPGFKTAALRTMNFDESYHGLDYDCRRSGTFDPETDLFLRKSDDEDSTEDDEPVQKKITQKKRRPIATGQSMSSQSLKEKSSDKAKQSVMEAKDRKLSAHSKPRPWNRSVPRAVSSSWTLIEKKNASIKNDGSSPAVNLPSSSKCITRATVNQPPAMLSRPKRRRQEDNTFMEVLAPAKRTSIDKPQGRPSIAPANLVGKMTSDSGGTHLPAHPDFQRQYGLKELERNRSVLTNMQIHNINHPNPTATVNSHSYNDFYSNEFESYTTRPQNISTVLSTTFEELHYKLSLNDHDSLFHL